ncbi:MAG: HAMP domain-containing sensor histidine kinase [Pseudomonadota bacterium]
MQDKPQTRPPVQSTGPQQPQSSPSGDPLAIRDATPDGMPAEDPAGVTGSGVAGSRVIGAGAIGEARNPGFVKAALSKLVNIGGLPAKLLFLTIVFVMIAEVLIFTPSIANFRINWLKDRLGAAYIASLATATIKGPMPAALSNELLMSAGVKAIAVKTNAKRRMIMPATGPVVIDASFALTNPSDLTTTERIVKFLGEIPVAFHVFVAPNGRMIRAYGHPGGQAAAGTVVEVILDETVLRRAMVQHAINIFWLSVVISMIAAALVFLALSRLLVAPMTRIASNMVAFAGAPEDPEKIIEPSGRTDEIGVTERELAAMQQQLAEALIEKNRLAQLGLAVSKINHDLRNMLSSAQLISDRLGSVQDPTVQRFAPKLIASLDRAIDFCNATLKFGRAAEPLPRRALFRLSDLLVEVADGLDLPSDAVDWHVAIDEQLHVDADREHLYRVLNNICRNAASILEQAKKTNARIHVSAHRDGLATRIVIGDNGPGVPAKARENLFRAFSGGARPGGTGLGLAISYELIAAHGGTIALKDTDEGATFELLIPDRRTKDRRT